MFQTFNTKSTTKKLQVLFSLFLFVAMLAAVSGINTAYAANCDVNILSDEPPPIDAIICPAIRGFNVLILLVGTGFTVSLIYHAIKLALALGDPKGFESARLGMVYTGIGTFVVLCFWGIFSISANILGINQYTGPQNMFDAAMNAFTKILEVAGVEGGTTSTSPGGTPPPAPTCVPGSPEWNAGACEDAGGPVTSPPPNPNQPVPEI